MDLKNFIRDVQDFPKPGIVFRDITPLLKDKDAFSFAIEEMAAPFQADLVVGPESRGFIFGCPVAYLLKAGFVPIRKKGKLPYHTLAAEYNLEYGKDSVEIHEDALSKGSKVLIVDDVLATAGTALAVKELVEKLGGNIQGFSFLIELRGLEGRKRIEGYPINSLLKY